MKEQEFLFTQGFGDLAECTEYYYNELGKLSQAPEITEKQRRKLRKWIVNSMNESIKLLIKQQSQINEISKTVQDENFKEFKELHKTQKDGTMLITQSNEAPALVQDVSSQVIENANEETDSKKNSKVSKNGKLGNKSQAIDDEQSSGSRDDDPMPF